MKGAGTDVTQIVQPSPEPTHPYPPRYWWLKRLTVLGLIVVVGTACLRVWWGRVAERELERVVAELRGRGEPVWPEDFGPTDLPDEQNAAVLLRAATEALDRNSEPPSATNMSYNHYPPFPRRWHRVADSAMGANEKALELARRARGMPRADWRVTISRPAFQVVLTHLNQSRQLAYLLADAAVHAHVNGDDAEAIERCRDVLALARAVDQQPFLVSHLVSIGIAAVGYNRIELIATDLHVNSTGATTAPRTGATPAQVRALIDEILARDDPAALPRALQSERMATLDTIDWTTAGNPLLRPMYRLDQPRVMRGAEGVLRASTQPTPRAAADALAAHPARRRSGLRLATAMSELISPTLSRVINTEWRIRMETRLAATALAAALYRAEHGRWPESVEALVPHYLPVVPLDPWGGGAPIKIALIPNGLPDGSPRPVVYSVGEDGQDDTAAGATPPQEPQFGYHQTLDQWRDLTRWAPPAATAPTADEEDDADDADATTQPVR